jgi:PhnB protein
MTPQRSVRPVPEGFHTVTSYLTVGGVSKLIDFIQKAFDGRLIERIDGPGGTVGHAEMRIGDSIVMMGDPHDKWPARPCNLYLYVPDVDAVYRRAIEAGGKSVSELRNQFYGDRSGGVEDPSGNTWWIATHIEDVPPDELRRRMEAMKDQH